MVTPLGARKGTVKWGEAGALPSACERAEAARLDVDAAVSVGLVLVRRAGLHLGETLIGSDGVDLHPALPGVLLRTGWLKGRRCVSESLKQAA